MPHRPASPSGLYRLAKAATKWSARLSIPVSVAHARPPPEPNPTPMDRSPTAREGAATTAESPSAPAPDADRCAAALVDVLPVVMRELRRGMREHLGDGLTVPQFRCLNYVSRHAGTSISEVAGFLGVTLATASAMVERLVRAGQVTVATSAVDRRRSQLRVSAAGRRLLERMRRGARRELAVGLEATSEHERQALIDAMAVLRRVYGGGAGQA